MYFERCTSEWMVGSFVEWIGNVWQEMIMSLNYPWHVKVQAGSSYELQVFDIAGKAVSFVSNIGENGTETLVDVSDYPNGLYFFVFNNDMQTSVKKVVKNWYYEN